MVCDHLSPPHLPTTSQSGLGLLSASLPTVCCGVLTWRCPGWQGEASGALAFCPLLISCLGIADGAELPLGRWLHRQDQAFPERLTEHDVHKGIEAAVGIAQADGRVVQVDKGERRAAERQLGQLKHVVGRPAHEEDQADGDGRAGHPLCSQPDAALRDGGHGGRHALQDPHVGSRDDHEGQGKGQEKLVQGEPVEVSVWVGQADAAAHGAPWEGDQPGIEPHRGDTDEGQGPQEADHQGGHRGLPELGGGDGVDGGQVAVNGHGGQDVGAGELAVGVHGRDEGTHGLAKVPDSIAHELVDHEGHAQEEEEVHH